MRPRPHDLLEKEKNDEKIINNLKKRKRKREQVRKEKEGRKKR